MFELVDSKPDIVLVIGGWNSSNTSHLQEIAEHKGLTTYWVDHPRCIEEGNKITWLTSWGEMKQTENWLPVRHLVSISRCLGRMCWLLYVVWEVSLERGWGPSSRHRAHQRVRELGQRAHLYGIVLSPARSPLLHTALLVGLVGGVHNPSSALGMDGSGGQREDRRDVRRVYPGQGACARIDAHTATSVRGFVQRAPPSFASATAQPHYGLRVVAGGGGCAGPRVRAEGGSEDAGAGVRKFAPVGVEGASL
jgi:hypothetical protein